MTVPGEIPGFGKGVMPPNLTEAESFLDEVDDVSRLIEGLHSGKISPEYVDKKIKERDAKGTKKMRAAKYLLKTITGYDVDGGPQGVSLVGTGRIINN